MVQMKRVMSRAIQALFDSDDMRHNQIHNYALAKPYLL